MQKFSVCVLGLFLLLNSCQQQSCDLASFEVYCEMVAYGAKPVGLSQPQSAAKLDAKWSDMQQIAKRYSVEIYREKSFPVTPLFPAEATEGKEVVVIYKGIRLQQYQQLKEDLQKQDAMAVARRLGRLLGYDVQQINELLMRQTGYATLASFDVQSQVTHLYYDDLQSAIDFYKKVLGLQEVATNLFAVSEDALLFLHSSDEAHPRGQPKSTAIAFLTDQLPQWYAYVQEQNIPIKYTYKPKKGGPHDGFVAVDPGGYLLEFEQFKQHPENELFMAYLAKAPRVVTGQDSLSFYGSISWTYHNDVLAMQNFYEEVLGFQLVADQGWTKIYRTSPTGFVGLVDERRGMMDYADEKAVELEWQVTNHKAAQVYFSETSFWNSDQKVLIGPEKYRYRIQED